MLPSCTLEHAGRAVAVHSLIPLPYTCCNIGTPCPFHITAFPTTPFTLPGGTRFVRLRLGDAPAPVDAIVTHCKSCKRGGRAAGGQGAPCDASKDRRAPFVSHTPCSITQPWWRSPASRPLPPRRPHTPSRPKCIRMNLSGLAALSLHSLAPFAQPARIRARSRCSTARMQLSGGAASVRGSKARSLGEGRAETSPIPPDKLWPPPSRKRRPASSVNLWSAVTNGRCANGGKPFHHGRRRRRRRRRRPPRPALTPRHSDGVRPSGARVSCTFRARGYTHLPARQSLPPVERAARPMAEVPAEPPFRSESVLEKVYHTLGASLIRPTETGESRSLFRFCRAGSFPAKGKKLKMSREAEGKSLARKRKIAGSKAVASPLDFRASSGWPLWFYMYSDSTRELLENYHRIKKMRGIVESLHGYGPIGIVELNLLATRPHGRPVVDPGNEHKLASIWCRQAFDWVRGTTCSQTPRRT